MKRYRKEKLASLVRDIVAGAIQHRLHDPRVSPFTSITRVEMKDDLQIAMVYLAVRGGDAAERKTLAAVRHAGGFIQRMVARGLSIRQCPELRFEIDERAKRVQQTMQILSENRRENPELFEPEPIDDITHGKSDLDTTEDQSDQHKEQCEG